METVYRTREEISDQLISYIHEKADALSELSVPEIERCMDSESLNPLIHIYLSADAMNEVLKDVINVDDERMVTCFAVGESISSYVITPVFIKLKIKIRNAFCKTLLKYRNRNVSIHLTIKYILISLLSVFRLGVRAILLPIILGMFAIYMKKGLNYFCNVY